MKDQVFKKNFIWNLIGTSLSSFTSLFFLIIVTWINGIADAGVFSIGMAIGLILYTIAEYSGRIYQVTDTENKIKDKDYIYSRFICLILVILISIIVTFLKKYNSFKSSIVIFLCLYKGLEAFSDVLYGVFQKYDCLYKAGQSCTMKSIISVIAFLIVDKITGDLKISCLTLVFVYLFFIIFFDWKQLKNITKFNYKVNLENVKKIFKREFLVFANSFAGVYILNAQKYALDSHTNDTFQAIFGYIIMPASVINLFTRFLILPYLNKFKEFIKKKDYKKLVKQKEKLKLVIVIFGALCITAGGLIGPEVLSWIYKTDLISYRFGLCIILFSYIMYSLSYVDLVVLTSLRRTLIQFVIYFITMIIAFLSSNILVSKIGITGAIISVFVTLWILEICYFYITSQIIKKLENNCSRKLDNKT